MAYNIDIPPVNEIRSPTEIIRALELTGTVFLPDTTAEFDRKLHREARRLDVALKTSRWLAVHPATLQTLALVRVDLG